MKNKAFASFITICLLNMTLLLPVAAIELDTSIDSQIKRNFDATKLELDRLPPPPTLPSDPDVADFDKTMTSIRFSEPIKLPKGTKFQVDIYEDLYGSTPKGKNIDFYSAFPVTKRYITVPTHTRFKAKVINSHPPQRAGNGGLLFIKVTDMDLRGRSYPINGYVTKANYKKVFRNNIKGRHGYIRGMYHSTRPGRVFYYQTVHMTSRLAEGPFTVLISPFVLLTGVFVVLLNFVGSPIFGLFYKGSELVIPAGARFEIKLLDDVIIE
jgi:hypothetical protein